MTWLEECIDDDNDDYRCKAIRIGKTTSASLSFVGCLFALFVIVVYKKFRFFTQRMVMYLLFPCFFLACFSLTSSVGNNPVCVVKGFLRNYAGLTQNLWIICIDIHLLILTVRQESFRHLEKVYHCVVWGGGLLISIIPLFGSHYGHAGLWCWIKGGTHYENALRVICYYAWLMLLVFGGGAIYSYIIWKVMSRIHSYEGTYNPAIEARKVQYKKNIKPLLFYPILDLILASVTTTNRIQNWADPGNPIFGLYLAHAIVSPLWGFANALLYLLNVDTIRQLHPVTFWGAIRNWSKSTFTFSKSVDTTNKKMEYTMKDEREGEVSSSHLNSCAGDMD